MATRPAQLANRQSAGAGRGAEADRDRQATARRQVYRPLVVIALAVGAGILLDRGLSLGTGWWFLALIGLACWQVLSQRSRPALAMTGLLLAVAATGAMRHHLAWRLFQADEIGRIANNQPAPICLRAIALDAPQRRAAPAPNPLRAIPQGEKTELLLLITQVRDGDQWKRSAGRTEMIVDGRLLGIHAGDHVEVFGQLRGGGEPLNPGQFDFAADARSDRELAWLRCESPDCVRLLQPGSRMSPWRWLGDTRLVIERTLYRQLGPERAPIAAAMLVGARHGVSDDRVEAFRRTGALHVLVVSGLHVGLVVSLVYAASRLGWFPRRPTLLVVMLLILGYTLLTGARPPAVRAAVLAEIMCLAALAGRKVLAINSLAAAALVVLAFNPSELFRSGPQLSFIAAATLIRFSNWQANRPAESPLHRLVRTTRPWPVRATRWVATYAAWIVIATLVVWITTAPLLACRFHLLAPVAVPMSLALFPLVSLAVLSSLTLTLIALVWPPLAMPISAVSNYAIDWLVFTIDTANEIPLGSLWTPGPSSWWTIGAYGLLGAGLLYGQRPRLPKQLTKVGIAWIAVGFVAATITGRPPADLRCSFLAVGHGCSVLVETPDGGTLLYDAGSLGSPEAAAETIAGVLWSKGIQRIDALVLSHADVDHFNATPELLDRFWIGGVYVSPAMFDDTEIAAGRSAPATLFRAIEQSAVPLHTIKQGDRLRLGELSAEILHPLDADIGGSDNAKSLVLALEYEGQRVLLPGDLEAPGIDDLMAQLPYDCDVLLAPHHGSARSDPPGFARWSTPEWVVVSGGGKAAYSAEAGRTYAASGARVLRTAETGLAAFTLGNPGIVCRQYREQPSGLAANAE